MFFKTEIRKFHSRVSDAFLKSRNKMAWLEFFSVVNYKLCKSNVLPDESIFMYPN